MTDAITAGNTYRNAVQLAGVGERSFFRWMAEGQNARPNTLARQFWQAVKKAEAQAIHRNVMVIQQAATKSWQASAWWLERRFPDDWADKARMRLTMSGPEDGPVQLAVGMDKDFEQALKKVYGRRKATPPEPPPAEPPTPAK